MHLGVLVLLSDCFLFQAPDAQLQFMYDENGFLQIIGFISRVMLKSQVLENHAH
jgi:hypothetical protein